MSYIVNALFAVTPSQSNCPNDTSPMDLTTSISTFNSSSTATTATTEVHSDTQNYVTVPTDSFNTLGTPILIKTFFFFFTLFQHDNGLYKHFVLRI